SPLRYRKASVDRNARQRTPTRRPSTSSLKARVNTMQRRTRPEKSPSTQNLTHAEPKEPPQHNVADCYVPKTRFTCQDRCKEFATSSPRLKYFPAEKIKKVDNSPAFTADPIGAIIMQQNPQESGAFYVAGSADQNNGQGDAMTNVQPTSQQRQHQNMHTVSQQQVGNQQAAHPIGQVNANSDSTLHQQVLSNQVHRPCVPHDQQEYPPQKTAQPLYRNAPQSAATPMPPNPMQQNVPGPTANPEKSKAENNECPDYECQPVGGRNAALYRQTMTAGQQPRAQSHMSMTANVSQSNSSQQYQLPVQSQPPAHNQPPRYSTPQNPQLAYQQLQQTMAQQQQLQQRAMAYQMQMMSNDPRNNPENLYNRGPQFAAQTPAQVPAQQGMTSPQEAMKNRNLQNFQAQQRSYAMNPQNIQLQPYSINVVNNQPHPMAQYQQQSVQLYRNPEQPLYRNPAEHPGHQLYRNPAGYASQQVTEQPGYNEQTSGRQAGQQPCQETPADSRQDDQQKRTSLSFTPSMIRDQEKMVATMKQQGVPFDILKRQFEALLNEQRRQLEYIEDLRQQDRMPEVERPATVTRRRSQTDEKPEWMIHLTPPRVSYMELEKMYEKQREKDRLARPMDQGRQIPQNEMPNQTNRQNEQQQYQHYQQDNRYQPQQMFAQPRPIGSVQSSPNVPAVNYQQYQHHQSFPSYQQTHYAHLQQPNPQFQHQQVSQQSPQQAQSQAQPNNSSAYETAKRTTEPSSLLKLRMYKECIRPQGRNNGLQDPQIVRKYLERSSESADVKRGLEYLDSLASKTPKPRLNGMQDRVEADHQLNERLLAASGQQRPQRISANGLENGRNPNNPPPQRLAHPKKDHEFSREYPRQKQTNPGNCYVQAERENGTVAAEQPATFYGQQHAGSSTPMIPYNEKNPTAARCDVMPYRFDASCSQHYQQMQQYYQNARNLVRDIGEGDTGPTRKNDPTSNAGFDRAGGDATGNMNGQTTTDNKMPMYRSHYSQPNLHEARTIGGVRYLARKQDYMPNTQLVSPETLIASRHLQPPVIY
ncbi:uncharacterized protein LOC143363011, partial [Halictus rubicundus]|uniref:uncharacterized protein LOC143363011 n=1 Tax=Halictus rubicundus TaxID=77578 RepID=UPI004035162C